MNYENTFSMPKWHYIHAIIANKFTMNYLQFF